MYRYPPTQMTERLLPQAPSLTAVTAVHDRQLLRHIRTAYNLNRGLQAFATTDPTYHAATVSDTEA
jgi:hypothetical protein